MQLESVLDLLAGDTHAPTTVRDPDQAARAHVADSLAALDLAEVRASRTIVDIGSGAGFPGLPLAVALPDAEMTLLESQRRKCDFLAAAVRGAELANARPVCARAEQWPAGLGAFDLAVARALAPQPVVLEYAAPLLREGGHLVDWRGRRDAAGEEAALRAASELGMERLQVERSRPFAGAEAHHLHLFAKTGPTPARFPRRAGVARKRPLGG
jgi:16S rRNA (guanine527-N7)-methyltransferase